MLQVNTPRATNARRRMNALKRITIKTRREKIREKIAVNLDKTEGTLEMAGERADPDMSQTINEDH